MLFSHKLERYGQVKVEGEQAYVPNRLQEK